MNKKGKTRRPRACLISQGKRSEWEARRVQLERESTEITSQLCSNVSTDKRSSNTERAELLRLEEIIDKRIELVDFVLKYAIDVELAKTCTYAFVGTIVTVQRYDKHDNPKGKPQRYRIVGFEETNPHAQIPELSYTSPLLDGLYGKRVDTDREPSPIIGTSDFVELLKIELPPAVLKAVA